MSETLSLTSGVPGRYATALFNLFREEGKLKVLEKDVVKLSELIDVSDDFKKLIGSPIFKREEQARAVIEALLENERDEVSVKVVSAEDLNKDQTGKLEQAVSKILDKKAIMHVSLDKSLIGGMIVKIGSRMIDTTIKSKLVKLQNIMKEVN